MSFRYLSTSKYYNLDGNKIEILKLRDMTLEFYGEHGITDWLTLNSYVSVYKNIKLDKATVQSIPAIGGTRSGFGIFSNNQRFIEFAPELIYSINDNWGILFGYGTGTVCKNIVSEPVPEAGIIFKK